MGPVVRSNSSNGSVLRAPNLVMTDNVQQSWYVGSIVMSRFVRSPAATTSDCWCSRCASILCSCTSSEAS